MLFDCTLIVEDVENPEFTLQPGVFEHFPESDLWDWVPEFFQQALSDVLTQMAEEGKGLFSVSNPPREARVRATAAVIEEAYNRGLYTFALLFSTSDTTEPVPAGLTSYEEFINWLTTVCNDKDIEATVSANNGQTSGGG